MKLPNFLHPASPDNSDWDNPLWQALFLKEKAEIDEVFINENLSIDEIIKLAKYRAFHKFKAEKK